MSASAISEQRMSGSAKVIENPEVPGLECSLPPPLPSPASSATKASSGNTKEAKKTARVMQENRVDSTGMENQMNSMQGSEHPHTAGHPWWLLTEAHTMETTAQPATLEETGVTWMDTEENNGSGKAKGKFFKRKSECIDPVQDAERVANAQKELSALMKPLQCHLCNAIMNSPLQAKLHYDGKPHQKKVSMFLNQSVKKLKPEEGQVASTTNNADWNNHCEVCKIWFTSLIDASQHYAGKKHLRATTGASKPKPKKPQSSQVPVDPTGRFGIGMSFSTEAPKPLSIEHAPTIAPAVVSSAVSAVNCPSLNWPFPTFRCEPCDVTANRAEQLEAHKRGARHLRMMKLHNLENPDVDDSSEAAAQSVPSSIDYSIYRTPSGQYYCAPCNRSFHSENSFAHHIESKKHKTQTNPKQPAPSLANNKKPSKPSK